MDYKAVGHPMQLAYRGWVKKTPGKAGELASSDAMMPMLPIAPAARALSMVTTRVGVRGINIAWERWPMKRARSNVS